MCVYLYIYSLIQTYISYTRNFLSPTKGTPKLSYSIIRSNHPRLHIYVTILHKLLTEKSEEMESAGTWEYMSLVNELTQGMEKAEQLRLHLSSTSQDELLQRILSSYDKALMILKWEGPAGQAQVVAPVSGATESSVSVEGSPKSEEMNKNIRDHQDYCTPKKRKLQPTRTDKVKVNSDNGFEGPIDDGYSWRKYGQKDILGAKYPRSYYRCTYRLVQNCWATKQVQRSDEDPTVFEITYKGEHTCKQMPNAVQPLASPEKKETKLGSQKHGLGQQKQTPLMNLKANLRVNTDNLDDKETPTFFSFPSTYTSDDIKNEYFLNLPDDDHLSPYSSLLLSPATSESNYFSLATFQLSNYGGAHCYQYSESDIKSSHASTTNSPIGGMEFPFDASDLDPNFPCSPAGYFS